MGCTSLHIHRSKRRAGLTYLTQMAADSIFVAALTIGPALVTVTSGSINSTQSVAAAGVNVLAFPTGPGSQVFSITTEQGSGSGTGSIEISSGCYVSGYNRTGPKLIGVERGVQLQHRHWDDQCLRVWMEQPSDHE